MHLENFADGAARQFSQLSARVDLLDVIRSLAGLKTRGDLGPAFEVSREIARITGRSASGVFVPPAALAGRHRRDLVVGTPTAGGHTVETQLRGFVDLLRPRAKVLAAGATLLPGLVGKVAIPRQTGAASAYWVGEGDAPTKSQQAFDQIPMEPRTVAAFTDISRKMLLQSSLDVQNFVGQDLTAAIALAVDAAALNGAGGTQPTGLLSQSGVLTQTIAGAAPTWAEIVGFETKVAVEDADAEQAAYLTTPSVRGHLRRISKVVGENGFIWEAAADRQADGTMNGYRAFVSSNAPQALGAGDDEHAIIFGNWSDLIIGMWGVLDLMVDPYSNSAAGGVRIVAMQDVDVAVRHPESFCVGQYTPA